MKEGKQLQMSESRKLMLVGTRASVTILRIALLIVYCFIQM